MRDLRDTIIGTPLSRCFCGEDRAIVLDWNTPPKLELTVCFDTINLEQDS
jgi:hypothetical protein